MRSTASAAPELVAVDSRDRGAAVVEFVLLAAVVSLLFAAVLQVGYALHVRNTATAHVIEGARAGARADAAPGAGVARARELLATTVPGSYGTTVTSQRVVVGGVQIELVTAHIPLPVVGPLGVPGTMTVTGQAFVEDQ